MRQGFDCTARRLSFGFLRLFATCSTFTRRRAKEVWHKVLWLGSRELVSDFYAAYDSIPCPQEKCLLHLMRDLNDDVLDNPYDESTKEIATVFAELLRGIVGTIDRWGLKSLFLRKHLADVARFYKRVSKTGNLSDAAF